MSALSASVADPERVNGVDFGIVNPPVGTVITGIALPVAVTTGHVFAKPYSV